MFRNSLLYRVNFCDTIGRSIFSSLRYITSSTVSQLKNGMPKDKK